jgi:uncharacterized SAM-binding protein YcdF (DUF218 family)
LRRRVARAALGAVLVLAGFSGPGARWLQVRGLALREGDAPDLIYMLAGERDQDRRVTATIQASQRVASRVRWVLTGNDDSLRAVNAAGEGPLTVGQWAVAKLADGKVEAQLLSGWFHGTDGEMAALAQWLSARPEVVHVTLVSSPFHLRRCVARLEAHLRRPMRISVAMPPPGWSDCNPWTVAGEMAKLARDKLGLGSAPLVTRRGWSRVVNAVRNLRQNERR